MQMEDVFYKISCYVCKCSLLSWPYQCLDRKLLKATAKNINDFSHTGKRFDRSCVVKKKWLPNWNVCSTLLSSYLWLHLCSIRRRGIASISLGIEILWKYGPVLLLMMIWDCCAFTFWRFFAVILTSGILYLWSDLVSFLKMVRDKELI